MGDSDRGPRPPREGPPRATAPEARARGSTPLSAPTSDSGELAPHAPIPASDESRQAARDRAHGLADGIVYGPVPSRRYGLNYGINLLPPSRKVCNWNCVYCQLGYTTEREPSDGGFPTPDELERCLSALEPAPGSEAFVVCGNGEPTLHPRFPDMVDVLVRVRDRRFPGLRLVCLSNGGEAWRPSVLAALKRLDEVGLKLDAGDERLLHRVNLPIRPASVESQIRSAKRIRHAVVQSCFFQGPVDNTTPEAVGPWLDAVARAMPIRVDLYTLSRSTPSPKLRAAPLERLHAIADALRPRIDAPVEVYGP